MIVMIDTGICNLRSVSNAFERIGLPITPATDTDTVAGATAIVLPGVGAFERGMDGLSDCGLVEVLKKRIAGDGVPVLGICLGMQLLADTSEEHGTHEGLGLIAGHVVRLAPRDEGFRVPNMGWCDTAPVKAGVLFPDRETRDPFYYVHSFHLQCSDAADVAAVIDYGGETVTVTVERGNIFGVQFHPEKSQDTGLDLFDRFAEHLKAEGRLVA